jgi:hypothetical protein
MSSKGSMLEYLEKTTVVVETRKPYGVPKVMNAFLTTPPTIQIWMARSIPTRISPNEIFK